MEQQTIDTSREYGPQPFDDLMKQHGLDNHAVVAHSPDHITHKMVAKARNGRFLSVRVRLKVLTAFNNATHTERTLQDLFNY